MSNKKANIVIFSIGACGYGLLEVLWRGHTHWSMLGAGGISFLGLSSISKAMKNMSLVTKAVIGGGLITAVEYIFGIVFNVILKKNVWDYSRMPFNINGQICALYSMFWVLLSFIFIPFAGGLNRRLERRR